MIQIDNHIHDGHVSYDPVFIFCIDQKSIMNSIVGQMLKLRGNIFEIFFSETTEPFKDKLVCYVPRVVLNKMSV